MSEILKKLKHPALKLAWIAEQLYGNRENKNRTKISEKAAGKKGWKQWELQRLEEIFAELAKDFQN